MNSRIAAKFKFCLLNLRFLASPNLTVMQLCIVLCAYWTEWTPLFVIEVHMHTTFAVMACVFGMTIAMIMIINLLLFWSSLYHPDRDERQLERQTHS